MEEVRKVATNSSVHEFPILCNGEVRRVVRIEVKNATGDVRVTTIGDVTIVRPFTIAGPHLLDHRVWSPLGCPDVVVEPDGGFVIDVRGPLQDITMRIGQQVWPVRPMARDEDFVIRLDQRVDPPRFDFSAGYRRPASSGSGASSCFTSRRSRTTDGGPRARSAHLSARRREHYGPRCSQQRGPIPFAICYHSSMTPTRFRKTILSWYRKHGRHDLPWRHTKDPWRILISEVMLQQTQVPRVVAKYPLFIRRFPTAQALARAPLREVLATWQGMGYNRRAVHLRELARALVRKHAGKVPASIDELSCLPGLGPNTAGAIRAFAFNKHSVFIETNIRRVFLHHFFPRRTSIPDARIMTLIQRTLPARDFRGWYSALMDYGALALKDESNPNRRSAHYARQSAFRGSSRELRGRIIAALIRHGSASPAVLRVHIASDIGRAYPAKKFSAIVNRMTEEGIITNQNGRITIPR